MKHIFEFGLTKPVSHYLPKTWSKPLVKEILWLLSAHERIILFGGRSPKTRFEAHILEITI